MRKRVECRVVAALLLVGLAARSVTAAEAEWSGYLSVEPRIFLDAPRYAEQPDAGVSPSAVFAPELRWEGRGGDDRFTVTPFLRFDADDEERTHADLRELIWQHVDSAWTWRLGIGRVFWGVTESRHLVDIVNQTDQVEDIDQEDKLGQPMISVERWFERAGSVAVLLLPGFRERPFPAADARWRGPVPVDTDDATYESGDENQHVDWALRWSRSAGNWDLGASVFRGTGREPQLLPRMTSPERVVLAPHYEIISQAGIDAQYTEGAWLWKLEAIRRRARSDDFGAWVAGFEYTLFDLGGRGADLGLLVEYLRDDRRRTAPPTIYDDDWFLGLRFAVNDVSGTAVLAGVVADSDGGGHVTVVEAERRIGELWKLEIEARMLVGVDAEDPVLGGFRQDSFVTLRLARYL